MKKDPPKSNQLKIDFKSKIEHKSMSSLVGLSNQPKKTEKSKIVSFNVAVNKMNKIKEEELRSLVLLNTKSF